MMDTTRVAFEKRTGLDYESAIERCREELANEGFGVLTEIDLSATLKKKLDVQMEPHIILGACHPPSALKSLSAMPEVGVLLPCNVTVSVEGGETVVRAMNPAIVMKSLDHPGLEELAGEIGGALQRVLEKVAAS